MGAAGSTPIHKAAKEGNLSELYVAVQKYSAHINEQEKEMGYTALHVASWQGFDAIVRELLKRGANPNIQDKEGRTALHLAALRSHTQVVQALLRANARRDIRDNLHHAAYDIAASRNPAIAQMIGPPPAEAGPGPEPQQLDGQPSKLPSQASSGPTAASVYPSMPGSKPNAPSSGTQQPGIKQDEYGLYGPQRHQLFPPSYQAHLSSGPAAAPAPHSAYPGYTPPSDAQQLPSYPSQPSAPAYPPSPYQAGVETPSQVLATAVQAAAEVPLPSAGASGAGLHELSSQASGRNDWAPTGDADWGATPSAPPAVQPPTTNVPAAAAAALAQQVKLASAGGSTSTPPRSTSPAPAPAAPSAPPQPKHGNALRGLFTAADLALQQLAKLGLNKHPAGPQAAIPQAASGGGEGPGQQGKAQAELSGAASGASSLGGGANYGGPPGRLYHYADIAAATEYFAAANLIGQGGFGSVYRGVLDGIPVAVKKMDDGPSAMQGQKEFAAEVNILTRLHHPHVVLLVGSCPDKGLLVYELMEGGSLEERLFKPSPARPALGWQDRVRVAAEIASALLYLHSAPEPIVHMDLKPANILLDSNLRAKLGDVGLARLMGRNPALDAQAPSTAQDSQLVGTMAYVDPEYLRTGHYSTKSDLYALGMVMLQMVTGSELSSVVNMVEKAREDVLTFPHVVDSRAGAWPAAEAIAFADIALKCCEFRRSGRPDLRTEVLPALLQLKQRAASLYSQTAPGGPASQAPTLSSLPTTPSSSMGGLMGPSGGADNAGVPAMFLCPITQDVMQDPVVAADGYTYEREAIAAWLSRASTSPLTNLPLASHSLVPNMMLRSSIKEWQQQRHQQQPQQPQRQPQYAMA